MKFSPFTIAREIEAQAKRLSRFLPQRGADRVDLAAIDHDGRVLMQYRQEPSDEFKRLCIVTIPSGAFLFGEGHDVFAPTIVGKATGPLYGEVTTFAAVDAIYERQAANVTPSAASQQLTPPPVASPISDADAIDAIHKHFGTTPDDDPAERWREQQCATLIAKMKRLGEWRP